MGRRYIARRAKYASIGDSKPISKSRDVCDSCESQDIVNKDYELSALQGQFVGNRSLRPAAALHARPCNT